MHVASGDRFVSFKASGDPLKNINVPPFQSSTISMHDYCFLPCMWPQVIDLFPSKQAGIASVGRRTNQNKCRTKNVHILFFFVVGEMKEYNLVFTSAKKENKYKAVGPKIKMENTSIIAISP